MKSLYHYGYDRMHNLLPDNDNIVTHAIAYKNKMIIK